MLDGHSVLIPDPLPCQTSRISPTPGEAAGPGASGHSPRTREQPEDLQLFLHALLSPVR